MPEQMAQIGRMTTPPPGPVRPDALPGTYRTQLTLQEEQQFQVWAKLNGIDKTSHTASGKPDPSFLASDNDYDMRGYWKAMQSGDPNAHRGSNLHFPDTYKTPYHQSFSNESKYALPVAPHWIGNKEYDTHGKVVWDESKGAK
jgi:hypothetical protein